MQLGDVLQFSATVRRVFGQHVVVVPSVMPGNTDTTLFHRLSDNIYRFTPFTPWSNAGIHGVDERATLSSHIDVIKYYFELMRSVCGHSKVT